MKRGLTSYQNVLASKQRKQVKLARQLILGCTAEGWDDLVDAMVSLMIATVKRSSEEEIEEKQPATVVSPKSTILAISDQGGAATATLSAASPSPWKKTEELDYLPKQARLIIRGLWMLDCQELLNDFEVVFPWLYSRVLLIVCKEHSIESVTLVRCLRDVAVQMVRTQSHRSMQNMVYVPESLDELALPWPVVSGRGKYQAILEAIDRDNSTMVTDWLLGFELRRCDSESIAREMSQQHKQQLSNLGLSPTPTTNDNVEDEHRSTLVGGITEHAMQAMYVKQDTRFSSSARCQGCFARLGRAAAATALAFEVPSMSVMSLSNTRESTIAREQGTKSGRFLVFFHDEICVELRRYKEAIRQLIFRHDLARNIDSGSTESSVIRNFTEFNELVRLGTLGGAAAFLNRRKDQAVSDNIRQPREQQTIDTVSSFFRFKDLVMQISRNQGRITRPNLPDDVIPLSVFKMQSLITQLVCNLGCCGSDGSSGDNDHDYDGRTSRLGSDSNQPMRSMQGSNEITTMNSDTGPSQTTKLKQQRSVAAIKILRQQPKIDVIDLSNAFINSFKQSASVSPGVTVSIPMSGDEFAGAAAVSANNTDFEEPMLTTQIDLAESRPRNRSTAQIIGETLKRGFITDKFENRLHRALFQRERRMAAMHAMIERSVKPVNEKVVGVAGNSSMLSESESKAAKQFHNQWKSMTAIQKKSTMLSGLDSKVLFHDSTLFTSLGGGKPKSDDEDDLFSSSNPADWLSVIYHAMPPMLRTVDALTYGPSLFAFCVGLLQIKDRPVVWAVICHLSVLMPTQMTIKLLFEFRDVLSKFDIAHLDELCKAIVETSKFPAATALYLAVFMKQRARRDLNRAQELHDLSEQYVNIATELLSQIESDHLLALICEIPSDIQDASASYGAADSEEEISTEFGGNSSSDNTNKNHLVQGMTIMEIALKYKLSSFLDWHRFQPIMWQMWFRVGFLHPAYPFPQSDFSWKEKIRLLLSHPVWLYYSGFGQFVVSTFLFVLYLILLSSVTGTLDRAYPYQTRFSYIEICLWLCNLGFTAYELVQVYVDGLATYLSSITNLFDVIVAGNWIILFIIRLWKTVQLWGHRELNDQEEEDLRNNGIYIAYAVIWGFQLIALWSRLALILRRTISSLATLMTMVGKMMIDVLNFMALLLTFSAGFVFALMFLVGPDMKRRCVGDSEFAVNLSGLNSFILYVFQALLGQHDWESMDMDKGNNVCMNTTRLIIFTIIIGVYLMFGSVLLLNLLIALMASTYDSIKERAALETNFAKMSSVYEYSRSFALLSPPFNLMVYGLTLLLMIVDFGIILVTQGFFTLNALSLSPIDFTFDDKEPRPEQPLLKRVDIKSEHARAMMSHQSSTDGISRKSDASDINAAGKKRSNQRVDFIDDVNDYNNENDDNDSNEECCEDFRYRIRRTLTSWLSEDYAHICKFCRQEIISYDTQSNIDCYFILLQKHRAIDESDKDLVQRLLKGNYICDNCFRPYRLTDRLHGWQLNMETISFYVFSMFVYIPLCILGSLPGIIAWVLNEFSLAVRLKRRSYHESASQMTHRSSLAPDEIDMSYRKNVANVIRSNEEADLTTMGAGVNSNGAGVGRMKTKKANAKNGGSMMDSSMNNNQSEDADDQESMAEMFELIRQQSSSALVGWNEPSVVREDSILSQDVRMGISELARSESDSSVTFMSPVSSDLLPVKKSPMMRKVLSDVPEDEESGPKTMSSLVPVMSSRQVSQALRKQEQMISELTDLVVALKKEVMKNNQSSDDSNSVKPEHAGPLLSADSIKELTKQDSTQL